MGVEVLLQGRGRPRPVVGVGGFLPARLFDVDGDRGQDVLNMRLGQPAVAAVAGPVSACELCDGALGAGTAGVELAPGASPAGRRGCVLGARGSGAAGS